MKRILTIQDISCVGKCSLTVALPIISAMKLEACILPTAVLSTHTGFKNFSFCDLTDEIDKITSAWKLENIQFDGIYTGFLGSFKQLKIIHGIFNEFGGENRLLLVDPCMGDNGKFYSKFDMNFATAMCELCIRADIITPNITEACFLTQTKYPDNGYDKSFVYELLDKLTKKGIKKIVLKSIIYDNKTCGVMGYDSDKKVLNSYFHELLPYKFSGTGDMFASVVFSKMMHGSSIDEAMKTAANFVLKCIKTTLLRDDRNIYGVDFESVLGDLINN